MVCLSGSCTHDHTVSLLDQSSLSHSRLKIPKFHNEYESYCFIYDSVPYHYSISTVLLTDDEDVAINYLYLYLYL
jgi:hypothetical protein